MLGFIVIISSHEDRRRGQVRLVAEAQNVKADCIRTLVAICASTSNYSGILRSVVALHDVDKDLCVSGMNAALAANVWHTQTCCSQLA